MSRTNEPENAYELRKELIAGIERISCIAETLYGIDPDFAAAYDDRELPELCEIDGAVKMLRDLDGYAEFISRRDRADNRADRARALARAF